MNTISRSESKNAIPLQEDPNYVTLSRMLDRYQNLILLTPASDEKLVSKIAQWQKQTQAELWSPLPYHRMKWLRSIEGARTLLLKLEQTAQSIRVQRTKRDVVKDLAEKRMIIKRLRNRVEEIGREVDSNGRVGYAPRQQDGDPESETMFDVLQQIRRERGKDQPPEALDDDSSPTNGQSLDSHKGDLGDKRDQLFESNSNIRQRQGKSAKGDQDSVAHTTGFSNLPETEKSLLASSAQHESITADLLSMAAQLKQQANALNFSLGQDKGFVDRAVEGLEQNMSAMGVASKGMKTLQRMSEEQGFWGRLKLQVMIAGLWAFAVLLVFAGPKLRF